MNLPAATLRLTVPVRHQWILNQRALGFRGDDVDGLPGKDTAAAVYAVLGSCEHLPPSLPRDPITPPAPREPARCVSGIFPRDTDAALNAFYGPPPVAPSAVFQFAYPMRLYSATGQVLTEHRCHPRIKDALEAVFIAIRGEYTEAEIQFLGLNIYHGCHNPRRRTGGQRWSLHAYSAAIDLDAARNGFGVQWSPGQAARPGKAAAPGWAWMPEKVVRIFECHGFDAGGRWRVADAMHFEGTTR